MVNCHIVVGLGFGDEGKGSWVDHLVRQHDVRYVVRFNGGAQAMHHVVAPDGRVHRFAQFGSGMLVPGTFTCLSRFMLIEPEALFAEAEQLERVGVIKPLERMIVSADAPVITPFNRLLNQIQEVARGRSRHGSCGFGIGITQQDVETLGDEALYVRDLNQPGLREKLKRLMQQKIEIARGSLVRETEELFNVLSHVDLDFYVELFRCFHRQVAVSSDQDLLRLIRERDTVFEGAQGVLLDQQYGFFPHCTRSNTTFENALALLDEAGFQGELTRVGLLRGYGTRHGAGPFMTEDTSLQLPACHNHTNKWQGQFRLGWFDAVTARYALDVVGGVDSLAITNLDRMRRLKQIKVCSSYSRMNGRYLNGKRLRLLTPELELLQGRTDALREVEAVYESLPGWRDNGDGLERYLDALEQLVAHHIHAFSITSGPQKSYRRSKEKRKVG